MQLRRYTLDDDKEEVAVETSKQHTEVARGKKRKNSPLTYEQEKEVERSVSKRVLQYRAISSDIKRYHGVSR